MKAKFTLLTILAITFFSVKSQMIQPPNDTFQNWTVSPYAPDSWCTYSSIAGANLGLSIKDVNPNDSYYGGVSVELISDSIQSASQEGVVGGILSLGTGKLTSDSTPPDFYGIPFSYRPDTVYAIYKYFSPGVDNPTAYILLTNSVPDTVIDTTVTKADTTVNTIITKADTTINTTVIAPGDTVRDTIITMADTTFDTIISPASTTIDTLIGQLTDTIISATGYLPVAISDTFTLGVFPITGFYLNTNTPDTLLLQFNSSWETKDTMKVVMDTINADSIVTDTVPSPYQGPVKGSTLILSQVFFGYVVLPTGLQEVADKMSFVIYPNPTASIINISSDENAAGFQVIISDMNGNLVYGGVLNGDKTSISVASFASGMYIYRIADSSGNILKQDRFIVAK